MRLSWIGLALAALFTTSVFADTLYEAQVGGYSEGAAVAVSGGYGVGVGVGVGLGASTALPYTAYQGTLGSGYYAGSTLPYEGPNYPYGQQCTGCNQCTTCH